MFILLFQTSTLWIDLDMTFNYIILKFYPFFSSATFNLIHSNMALVTFHAKSFLIAAWLRDRKVVFTFIIQSGLF